MIEPDEVQGFQRLAYTYRVRVSLTAAGTIINSERDDGQWTKDGFDTEQLRLAVHTAWYRGLIMLRLYAVVLRSLISHRTPGTGLWSRF